MPDYGTPTWSLDERNAHASGSVELILDAWTPMSFKRAMGNRRTGGHDWVSPGWVGRHGRRLTAYRVLQSYIDNAARVFLGPHGLSGDILHQDHREYGDASLIVSQVVAALIGEEVQIVTEGASEWADPDDDDDGVSPANQAKIKQLQLGKSDLTSPPTDPATGMPSADPVLVGAAQDAVAQAAADSDIDDQISELSKPSNSPETDTAHELQEWLKQWARDERLSQKMLETERNAVGLGDGIYVLGWNGRKGRARLRCFDPGFYFPVLADDNEDDYPERVHIAWEMEPDIARPDKRLIRRITWELDKIDGATPAQAGGFAGFAAGFLNTITSQADLPDSKPGDMFQRFNGVNVTPLDGDALQPDGTITRKYAWNDQPSAITCYMTDAVWEMTASGQNVEDLSGASAIYLEDEDGPINRRDLQIDFIPVVHLPNTVAIQNHYGRSTLSPVLQILDDLANTDTDSQAASATTARPILGLSGASFNKDAPTYQPGEILETGDGKLDYIDTSKSLDALAGYTDRLLERLSVSGRLPAAVIGRVDPSKIPSGVALALSFGPLASMVGEMRLVRDDKYSLLFKFAWRLALAGQATGVPGTWVDTRIEFGSYLPQDRAAAVDMVQRLRTAPAGTIPAVSLETGVSILKNSGLPIEDVAAEVDRIESRDFVGADNLLTATGDEDGVFDYLGRQRPPGLTSIKPPPPPMLVAAGQQPPGTNGPAPSPPTPPPPGPPAQ